MSARVEVEAFLNEKQPDVLIMSETKWKTEWGMPEIGKELYNI